MVLNHAMYFGECHAEPLAVTRKYWLMSCSLRVPSFRDRAMLFLNRCIASLASVLSLNVIMITQYQLVQGL